jgi:hypothetical protein
MSIYTIESNKQDKYLYKWVNYLYKWTRYLDMKLKYLYELLIKKNNKERKNIRKQNDAGEKVNDSKKRGER